MDESLFPRVTLDPGNPQGSMQTLAATYHIPGETLRVLARIVALYPRAAQMYINDSNTTRFLPDNHAEIIDLFTFDMDADELILYSRDPETLIDGMIEMAMYLAGFTTMMGNEDNWVIEFTIGAWKHVKKRIKRELDIPVQDHPTAVAGLPPQNREDLNQSGQATEQYPFRALVSHFTLNAFDQMVRLAARDNITVYFPPEAHHKVMAAYVYMQRAMKEVAQNVTLNEHATFNARLVQAVRRIDQLFKPSSLPRQTPPSAPTSPRTDQPANRPAASHDLKPDNPFAAFIDELFAEDDSE